MQSFEKTKGHGKLGKSQVGGVKSLGAKRLLDSSFVNPTVWKMIKELNTRLPLQERSDPFGVGDSRSLCCFHVNETSGHFTGKSQTPFRPQYAFPPLSFKVLAHATRARMFGYLSVPHPLITNEH